MTILNTGTLPDRLIGAESPIAERVDLRRSEGFGADQHEVPLPDGIEIAAGSLVILEPLGEHLGLVGLRVPLPQGETFPLTLTFERAATVHVTGRVRRRQDAAGVMPIAPVVAGDLTISLVSAPPAPGPYPGTPAASPVADS
jgi:copper(I)-binding protein